MDRNWMLCKTDFRLMVLNAFDASTRRIAPEVSSSKIFDIACIAASHPDDCPAHSCKDPALCITSSLNTDRTALPIILRRTSPIPIGRTQSGFFSKGISRHSMDYILYIIYYKILL